MDKEPKKVFHAILGLVDYLRDGADDVREEIVRRGEERSEDIRDFWDDLVENLSGMIGFRGDGASVETDSEEEQPERETVLAGVLADLDVNGVVSDLVEGLGLARAEDIEDLGEQLDRIGRAIENMD